MEAKNVGKGKGGVREAKENRQLLFRAKKLDILNSAAPLAPPLRPSSTQRTTNKQGTFLTWLVCAFIDSSSSTSSSYLLFTPQSPNHFLFFHKCHHQHLSARAHPAPGFLSRCGGALLLPYSRPPWFPVFSNESSGCSSTGSSSSRAELWLGEAGVPGLCVRWGSSSSVPAHGPPPRLQGGSAAPARGGPSLLPFFLVRAFNASSLLTVISRSPPPVRVALRFRLDRSDSVQDTGVCSGNGGRDRDRIGVEPARHFDPDSTPVTNTPRRKDT